jgi:hypothetical protein
MTETSPLATMELLGETAHGKEKQNCWRTCTHLILFFFVIGSCGVLVPNMVARLVKVDGTGNTQRQQLYMSDLTSKVF